MPLLDGPEMLHYMNRVIMFSLSVADLVHKDSASALPITCYTINHFLFRSDTCRREALFCGIGNSPEKFSWGVPCVRARVFIYHGFIGFFCSGCPA